MWNWFCIVDHWKVFMGFWFNIRNSTTENCSNLMSVAMTYFTSYVKPECPLYMCRYAIAVLLNVLC